jgi:hypothetical protein
MVTPCQRWMKWLKWSHWAGQGRAPETATATVTRTQTCRQHGAQQKGHVARGHEVVEARVLHDDGTWIVRVHACECVQCSTWSVKG